jgi:hypothetical protein
LTSRQELVVWSLYELGLVPGDFLPRGVASPALYAWRRTAAAALAMLAFLRPTSCKSILFLEKT